MKKTIMDYFSEDIEYPCNIALDPIPMNTLWSYVSSTFLNGFINYVDPISIYVLDRYSDNKTNDILNIKKQYHTNLSMFGDDIIILSKIPETDDKYVFFWFDMDVSDCCIGRFETNDSQLIVQESLENWLQLRKSENSGREFSIDHDNGILNYHKLPIEFMEGWVSF